MPATDRCAHPLVRYFSERSDYGPLPVGVLGLFYLLYGQMRSARKKDPYVYQPVEDLQRNLRVSVLRWAQFLEACPEAAAVADSGTLFEPPARWPTGWPTDWPAWVHPIHLHRALGGGNALSPNRIKRTLTYWVHRPGVPEVAAWVAGVPLGREDRAHACRGARQLLQAPQFLVWAYNVDVRAYPRPDVSPFVSSPCLYQLSRDPLATEDVDVLNALPRWMIDPEALKARRRTFNPLRTQAPDVVRYAEDEFLGRRGAHLQALGPVVPVQARCGYKPRWVHYQLPLYLTT